MTGIELMHALGKLPAQFDVEIENTSGSHVPVAQVYVWRGRLVITSVPTDHNPYDPFNRK